MSLTGFPITYAAIDSGVNLNTLFPASEVGGYFSFQDLSKLKQNSDGTTDAAVGSPVGYIEDLSGNGYHAVQPTASRKPTLRQDAGGKYYLEFDGVDDELEIATSSTNFQVTNPSIFMAMETSDTAAMILHVEGDNLWAGIFDNSASGSFGFGGNTTAIYVDGSALTFTTRNDVRTAVATGSIVPQQWNLSCSDSSGWSTQDKVVFGRIGYALDGDVYALGWRRDAITDSSDIALVNDWLNQEAEL